MSEYRLLYFPFKGRAEPLRLMLAHAGAPFDDVRITQDWPKLKSETPFGQMPVLEYNGQKLAQTKAICRFLGRQLGMFPDNHWEAAQLDMLVDRRDDIFGTVNTAFGEKDPEKKKEIIKKGLEESVIPGTQFYEDWLAKSKSGYFGSKLSWADFFLYNGFMGMRDVFGLDWKRFPHISLFMEKISNLPNVKKFHDEHPNVPQVPASFGLPPK